MFPTAHATPHPVPLTALCTLLMLLAMPPETMAETTPQNGAAQPAAPSSTPIRGRGYVDDYAELNARREGVTSLPSGVQYEVLKSGKGKLPRATDTVRVHYRAMLSNGVEFDNTYERDEPATLELGGYLLPGLKEALLLMKEGDEWRVTIPAKLALQERKLLRKRDLIYEITLLAIVAPADTKKQQSGPH